MSVWVSLLLGIVQGATEFLPVSSSGHLAIVGSLLDVAEMKESLLFDVLLHIGTLGAVFAAFHRDIAELCGAFLSLFSARERRDERGLPARRLLLLLAVATVPLLFAVFFESYVSVLADDLRFVGCALVGTGVLLYIADRVKAGKKNEKTALVSDAVMVGLMQAVAVIPGLSRSGSTIAAGLMRGFGRGFAVRFSFLMSIPAVLGAVLLELGKAFSGGVTAAELAVYIPGMLAAGIVGYGALVLLKRLAAKGRFGVFAVYCAAVGLVTVTLAIFFG
ncbi:MAG: undecaprenyl-diphosphate phosphatase [Oscillospiraceae bacterium]|jgi:undecaprenyl-diphosphatase|nr:undecaprenyl-diphosphate phosphatase [Oscillospiraceae bacterium]